MPSSLSGARYTPRLRRPIFDHGPHDLFPSSYWQGFQTPPGWQGVAMDTHIYQMFSQDVSFVFILALLSLLTICEGGQSFEPAAHPGRVQHGVVPLLVRSLAHRRRVDARRNGLRDIPERPRCRRTLRRLIPRLDARGQLLRHHRFVVNVQLELQDLPPPVLGGTGAPSMPPHRPPLRY